MAAFEHERLYDGHYVCVMRKGHRLAKGALTLDRYCEARHMLVSFSGRPYGFIDEALASLGRQRRVVLTVNQFFTAGLVVENSDLLTVLPRHFIRSTGAPTSWCSASCPSRCRRCTWTPSGTGTRRRGRSTRGCGSRSPRRAQGASAMAPDEAFV